MSSREIAKLTGKDHAHVMRDIRVMLVELYGEIGLSSFGSSYFNSQNKKQPEFRLPRRETDILVSGYNITMRAKIIDRWHELEQKIAQPQFAIPQTRHEALRLAADLAEKNAGITGITGQLAIAAPKAEVLDRIADSTGMFNLNNSAKILKQPPIAFNTWVRDELGWMYYRLRNTSCPVRLRFRTSYSFSFTSRRIFVVLKYDKR